MQGLAMSDGGTEYRLLFPPAEYVRTHCGFSTLPIELQYVGRVGHHGLSLRMQSPTRDFLWNLFQ